MAFDSSKLKSTVIVILAALAALYLGITSATAQYETLAWVIGSAVFIACVSLRRKIWMLIPFTSALGFTLAIPGKPEVGLLGVILAIGFSLILFLMRKLPYRFTFTEMDFWILVLSACVLQVYIRNPVGMNIFGGGTVGGKPYFIYALYLIAGIYLASIKVSENELRWIFRLSVIAGVTNMSLSFLGNYFPLIGYITGSGNMSNNGPDQQTNDQPIDNRAANRIGYLGMLGSNLSLWISSYISPVRALLKPTWCALVIIAISAATMAGYRNSIMSAGFVFLIGIAYRSGLSGIVLSFMLACCSLALLAVVNQMFPLPPNMQRSMTFLPGTWEERYRIESKNSSEWRFEIWKEVILTDRWIKNKWLGDGLGFKTSELAGQQALRDGSRAGVSGFDAQREAILVSGDYHSGPVQTIRTIGYIGLLVLLICQIRLAIRAHRQIQRCKNTAWFPLSLFIGIPLIGAPFFFVLVFGTFKDAAVMLFIGYGMIRMLENNLPLPAYQHRKHKPFLLTTKHQQPVAFASQ